MDLPPGRDAVDLTQGGREPSDTQRPNRSPFLFGAVKGAEILGHWGGVIVYH